MCFLISYQLLCNIAHERVTYTYQKEFKKIRRFFRGKIKNIRLIFPSETSSMQMIIILHNLLGFGSVSKEQMESSTLDTVSAGDHCSFKISKQICPLLLILQW